MEATVAKVGRRGEERKERADSAQLLFHSISAPLLPRSPCHAPLDDRLRPVEVGRRRKRPCAIKKEWVCWSVGRPLSVSERARGPVGPTAIDRSVNKVAPKAGDGVDDLCGVDEAIVDRLRASACS